jgi:hypothetical protein
MASTDKEMSAVGSVRDSIAAEALPDPMLTEKTLLKLMSELFTQLDELTSGTSFGSAKVMSTHCFSR